MKVGLEQRAGSRQTSPVSDCWPVTLVPAVSGIPPGAGGSISVPAWRGCFETLPTARVPPRPGGTSIISPLLRVFALKMIYHTWQLPNFLNSARGIVVVRRGAAPRPQHKEGHQTPPGVSRLCSTDAQGPPRLVPSAGPSLGMAVETPKPSDWRAEENEAVKQSCNPVLQEHQHITELGLLSLV